MRNARVAAAVVCGLLLAGCAGNDDRAAAPAAAPSPAPAPEESQGPHIVARQTVDWTRLNAIGAIELKNVRFADNSEGSSLGTRNEDFKLAVFPQQKLIVFDIQHSGSCRIRGQLQHFSFVASPGADVSDEITCSARGIFRYTQTLSYTTSTHFAAGALTIDGRSRMHTDWFNDNDQIIDREDVATEMHGSIRIGAKDCRVESWRVATTGLKTFQRLPSEHIDEVAEATPATSCALAPVGR